MSTLRKALHHDIEEPKLPLKQEETKWYDVLEGVEGSQAVYDHCGAEEEQVDDGVEMRCVKGIRERDGILLKKLSNSGVCCWHS